MDAYAHLPALSDQDIQNTLSLVLQANPPSAAFQLSPHEQQALQDRLATIVKQSQAWGLIAPFLAHDEPNVQFFGAHIAHVKIARDWNTISEEQQIVLKDSLLQFTGTSMTLGRAKFVLTRLYVAVTALAMKMTTNSPPRWPDWLISALNTFAEQRSSREALLDFVTIAVEEVHRALKTSNVQIDQGLSDAVPVFMRFFMETTSDSSASVAERVAALKCLKAWIAWGLTGNDLTSVVPTLISLLSHADLFVEVSDVLQDILTSSALAQGYGSKTLTEPVLRWVNTTGTSIAQRSLQLRQNDTHSVALCGLLVALGEHSNLWFATQLDTQPVQNFINLVLVYTGFPGYYGIDEEESETTLSFWYLLQESLWEATYPDEEKQEQQMGIAKELYREVVNTLRRKVTWSANPMDWDVEQNEKFNMYRRNVGDTIINACYVLRDSYLEIMVNTAIEQVAQAAAEGHWENLEATLFCIKAAHEALSNNENPLLGMVFGEQVLGRLPHKGEVRLRRTVLALIGEYCLWFSKQPTKYLLGAVDYTARALQEPQVSFQAASALRHLCDANRAILSPHVQAFEPLLASVDNLPVEDRSRVLESIASVISALSPHASIEPIKIIVNPILQGAVRALNTGIVSEETRILCVAQLQCLAGIAKGLTTSTDDSLEPTFTPDRDSLSSSRNDPSLVELRKGIVACVEDMVKTWPTDTELSSAISDLIKAITALPSEATLLSLSPQPLLQMVVYVLQRHITATWLVLANILIRQLQPPPTLKNLNPRPDPQEEAFVKNLFQALLEPCLASLLQAGFMEANPDIVQDFFNLCNTVVDYFPSALFALPLAMFGSLMNTTVMALLLQERYSLVASCKFLNALLKECFSGPRIEEAGALMTHHGRDILSALLYGVASVAPRSTLQNMSEILTQLSSKRTADVRGWSNEILFSVDFSERHPKADRAIKEEFIASLLSSRSAHKTRAAVLQFQLVTRGLEGTSYGYSAS